MAIDPSYSLFPSDPPWPPGFAYCPGFISAEEEIQLLAILVKIELHPMIFQGFEAKRKVAGFGYDYSFDKRHLSMGKPIPADFSPLIKKVSDFLSIETKKLAELLVTKYPVGSVINWHRDAPPFDLIAGISLLSDCTFKLRPYDKSKQSRSDTLSFPVKRRSLYVMQGEARSEWEHSISPVKSMRYSITLRTLKQLS